MSERNEALDETSSDAAKLISMLEIIQKRRPELLVELHMPASAYPSQFAFINQWNSNRVRAYFDVVRAIMELVNGATELHLAIWRYKNRDRITNLMNYQLENEIQAAKANVELYPMMNQQNIERMESGHKTYQMQQQAAQAVLQDQIQDQKRAKQAKLEQAVLDVKAREDRMKEMYRGMGWTQDSPEGAKRWNDMVLKFEKELEELFSDGDSI